MRVSSRAVTVPGKLLLFGEHAAVFGYPAVGMTVPQTLTVRAEPSSHPSLTFDLSDAAISGEDEASVAALVSPFLEHVSHVAAQFAVPLPTEHLTVTSQLPMGSGFGSSAALCTAIARLLLENADNPAVDRHRVWRIAHELERFFHGTPSGIDTGLTSLGGAQAFYFDRDTGDGGIRDGGIRGGDAPPLPRAAAVTVPPAHIVFASIPRRRSTKELVAMVRAERESRGAAYDEKLRRLGALSAAVAADEIVDSVAFGDAVEEAQRLLGELGVSTPELETVLSVGRSAGARSGKLSGAGGGGAFYLVCDDDDTAKRVGDAVNQLPLLTAPSRIADTTADL